MENGCTRNTRRNHIPFAHHKLRFIHRSPSASSKSKGPGNPQRSNGIQSVRILNDFFLDRFHYVTQFQFPFYNPTIFLPISCPIQQNLRTSEHFLPRSGILPVRPPDYRQTQCCRKKWLFLLFCITFFRSSYSCLQCSVFQS